uniref:Uncharacterized protein n=1 Tax=Cacopsylla melanoneura TaxID=428564 RepID=A0A8D8Q063_9HEMI
MKRNFMAFSNCCVHKRMTLSDLVSLLFLVEMSPSPRHVVRFWSQRLMNSVIETWDPVTIFRSVKYFTQLSFVMFLNSTSSSDLSPVASLLSLMLCMIITFAWLCLVMFPWTNCFPMKLWKMSTTVMTIGC